jgi:filamentous hemagglutinin
MTENAAAIQGNTITINAKAISNIGSSMTQFGTDDTNITAATTLDNTGGSIVTNGTNLTIKADAITDNQSKIIHAGTGTLELTATTGMSNTNGSSIQTNGNVALKADAIDNTKGSITALQGIEVTGNTLTNQQGALAASKEVSITLQNGLNNQNGTVEAGKALTIQAQSVDNKNGSISSLDASGMTVTAVEGIDNTAGMIGGNGDVNLTTQSLTNTTGKVLSQGSINADISQSINNTSGIIAAKQNITIGKTGTSIVNATLGSITAGGNLTAQANTLSNTGGTMAANTDVTVTATSINGTGTVTAGQDINLTVNGNVTNSADSNVKANRDVNLTAVNVTNLGSIAAVGNLNVNANTITNQTNGNLQGGAALTVAATGDINNSGTVEGNTATISAKNITNTGAVFGDTITMTADTISNHDNAAVIAATKNVNLYAKTSLENKDDATIYSMGNINIAGSKNQDGSGEYTDKTDTVLNQSASIEADGNIGIYSNTLTNKMREYEVGQTVVSSTRYDQEGVYQANDYYYSLFGDKNFYFVNSKTNVPTSIEVLSGNLHSLRTPVLCLLDESVIETSVISKSSIGKITAGSNLKLRVGITNNDMGWILANGILDQVGVINNIAIGNVRNTTQHLLYLDHLMIMYDSQPGWSGEDKIYATYFNRLTDWGLTGKSYYQTTTQQISGGLSALFGGGQQVIIQGGNVNNTTVAATSIPINTVNNITSSGSNLGTDTVKNNNTTNQTTAIQPISGINAVTTSSMPINNMQTLLPSAKTPVNPVKQNVDDSKFTIPTNGMFTTHQEPNSKYLVETNPRFANYGNFISSDYVLDQLGIDPANTMKRLGDGFYEEKLVREQVTDLTGRYYLNGYSSAEEQYKALMDNGVTYAKEFNLQVGVALTSEQMAQLTSDMVWMVEKEVDGQKVLVPEVYLSSVGNADLKADGAVIAADNVTIKASGDVNNAGVIKATEGVDIQAVNIANYGGTINGSNTTTLNAQQDLVNIGGLIKGDKIDLTAGNDFKNQTISFTSTLPFQTKTTIGNIASINAGDSLTINAHDIAITGAEINATKDVTMNATGNFTVDSIQEQDHFAFGKNLKDTVSNVVSNINAGNNVSITSTGDTTLKGAQISAGNSLDLTAGGNINISAVKDETILDQTVGIRHGTKRTRTDDETVIGTSLQGDNQVTITAGHLPGSTTTNPNGGNINIEGSYIASENGKVEINADKDVTIQDVTEKHESLVVTHTKKSGFLSSKTTDTMDHALINEVVGSTISGDQVSISSGNDLTVKGSNVVGTNDVSLTATNDVNITSAAETGDDDHYSYTKKSGLFSGGGLGFTIGSQSTKTTTNEQTLDQVGSTIGSIDGSVSITAHNDVNSAGTTFVTGKDLNITGKDVTIDNTVNTVDSQTKYEFKQSGLSVSLGGGIVDTATSAYNNIERSGQVEDDRLKTLYDYKAYKDLDKINDQIDNGTSKENLKQGVSVSVSIGSTKTTTEQTAHTETVNTSNINAGGNVNITATAGDVNLIGTNINATDVTLDAKNNINIESAENKMQTDTNTSSSSWSIGGTIGTGYFANASKGSSSENENAITNTGSVINASGTLTLNSGNDTNIIGSQVSGDKVVATIDGNLNIASKQDTDDYTAKNQSSGFGVSTGQVDGRPLAPGIMGPINKTATGGVTGSVSQGKTDSTYASVTDQAGIFAGTGGFDIYVGKNTDLKGAIIIGPATPDKNKLSTDTLTYSNIQNKADYSASSAGIGYSSDKGFTSNPGMPVSGDADSTTHSAISPGKIIVGGVEVNPEGLSRDPSGSLNALGKIFDKKTVQEKQELAQVFSEEANKLVGDIASRNVTKSKEAEGAAALCKELAAEARKSGNDELANMYEQRAQSLTEMSQDINKQWGDSGAMKSILHGVVGGIVAGIGGGNVVSGAAGASASELAQKAIANLSPGEQQIASGVIGATVAKILGGDAQIGGITATQGTKYNDQMPHPSDFSTRDMLVMALGGTEAVNLSDDAVISMFVKAAKDVTFKETVPGTINVLQGTSDFASKIADLPIINQIPGAKMVSTADLFIQFPGEIIKNASKNYDVEGYTIEMALEDAFKAKGIETIRDLTIDTACDILADKYKLGNWEKWAIKQVIKKTAEECGIKNEG